MPAGAALHEGVLKFLVGDVVKIALAAAALPSGWALIKRRRGLR
jgi:biotin transport system substrate-specific component